MSGIAHSVRKRLSIATTRTKTVEKNISAEYTSQKHSLIRGKETLEKAVAVVKKKAHADLGDEYKQFSELIAGDAPADSVLYTKARDALEASNTIHSLTNSPLDQESVASKLISHVEAYLSELETVEKEFPSVERHFVEASRYERKVSKLTEKTNGQDKSKHADKVSDRASRNLSKLEKERAAFQTKLDSVIEMMNKSNAKFEKILECIYTAFWVSEDEFLTSTLETTKDIREHSKEAQPGLVSLDVSSL